jgi:hypothetical protein
VGKKKFLLELIQGVSSPFLFFLVWLAITSLFVGLMVSYYRRQTRRNFRPDGGLKTGKSLGLVESKKASSAVKKG